MFFCGPPWIRMGPAYALTLTERAAAIVPVTSSTHSSPEWVRWVGGFSCATARPPASSKTPICKFFFIPFFFFFLCRCVLCGEKLLIQRRRIGQNPPGFRSDISVFIVLRQRMQRLAHAGIAARRFEHADRFTPHS